MSSAPAMPARTAGSTTENATRAASASQSARPSGTVRSSREAAAGAGSVIADPPIAGIVGSEAARGEHLAHPARGPRPVRDPVLLLRRVAPERPAAGRLDRRLE